MNVNDYWQQLTVQALVGAGRQPLPPAPAELAELLGDPQRAAERALLDAAVLSRGYLDALSQPQRHQGAEPAGAPDENLPEASAAAQSLLQQLLHLKRRDLLEQWIDQATRRGLLAATDSLSKLLELGRQDRSLRPLLLPVLGQHSRWLAQYHQAGSWLSEAAVPDSIDVGDETLWRQGTPQQRLAWLQQARRHDPAAAREALAAVLTQERAETREILLGGLAVALGPDDETLLEKSLGDRSRAVRTTVVQLLARLPDSAWQRRMLERVGHWLRYDPDTHQLLVELPSACPADLCRDGVEELAPSSSGERAWWLQQALSLLAPAVLCRRLGLDRASLYQLASATEWQQTLQIALANAALLHQDAEMAELLLAQDEHWAELFGLQDAATQYVYLQRVLSATPTSRRATLKHVRPVVYAYRHDWDRPLSELMLDVLLNLTSTDIEQQGGQYRLLALFEHLSARLEPHCVLARVAAMPPETRQSLDLLLEPLLSSANLRSQFAAAFPEPLLESPR
ncbi:DUF5691 domain-containing protein [Chitinimonas lacunae]|uniref:DUF5691 domain-containing protein n=1 Tax=Chitinimonas lacunae TaxID=1963018 RepID=A0ABV8MTN7_9NEIS